MAEITDDTVRNIGQRANIQQAYWPTIKWHLKSGLTQYEKAKEAYGLLRTRRDKLKEFQKIERAVTALNKHLPDPGITGIMISHEFLVRRMMLPTAEDEDAVQGDVRAVENLAARVKSIIEHLVRSPENVDELIAKHGASKPAEKVWDACIVSCWQKIRGELAYTEGSDFVEFFRAFDEVAHPSRQSVVSLPVETIRYRVEAAMRWLSSVSP